MSSITVTREQLYERVWSKPMVKVAAEFGLSDVAVKKMCRKWNVPTPSRGYWAKLEAGQRLEKIPLPKQSASPTAQVDPALNAQRREELQRNAVPPSPDGTNRLEIPATLEINRLHPQARAIHAALKKAKADHNGMINLRADNLPLVDVSQASADRLAKALHVVYSELESRGVTLHPVSVYQSKRLGFRRGEDEMALSIEEPIATVKRAPTPEELRRPSREWKLESNQPSGHFRFIVHECHGTWSNRILQRNEGPKRTLDGVLYELVEKIWGCFVNREEERQRRKAEAEAREKAEVARQAAEVERKKVEAERRRVEAEQKAAQEALRREEERQEQHRHTLGTLAAARVENALRAAEWWRLHQLMLSYAAECERRWSAEAGMTLTSEQRQWLTWLRAEADAMSPFTFGYPNLEKDGPFDGAGIPIGGPYPPTTSLPLPPTLPPPGVAPASPAKDPVPKAELPPKPELPEQPVKTVSYSPPQQYPFWLLHRGRR